MTQPCKRCALAGTSCCKNHQIVLTTGDFERIARFTGNQDFSVTGPLIVEEIQTDYDPQWLPLIMESGNHVKFLRRTPEKTCILLTENGCQLPFDHRPLMCRLYPYTYTEDDILGIDTACPISKENEWTKILEQLEMPSQKAREWRAMLYSEIRMPQALI